MRVNLPAVLFGSKDTPARRARIEFTCAYIECALWASTDNDYHGEGDSRNLPPGESNGGAPLDENYTADDLSPECLGAMLGDCEAFLDENARDCGGNLERAGHDFWLTRNDHGAGFWDGDWPEPAASRLTEASKRFGTVDLYIGDDGKIYCWTE